VVGSACSNNFSRSSNWKSRGKVIKQLKNKNIKNDERRFFRYCEAVMKEGRNSGTKGGEKSLNRTREPTTFKGQSIRQLKRNSGTYRAQRIAGLTEKPRKKKGIRTSTVGSAEMEILTGEEKKGKHEQNDKGGEVPDVGEPWVTKGARIGAHYERKNSVVEKGNHFEPTSTVD